jgi:hypothetical protein
MSEAESGNKHGRSDRSDTSGSIRNREGGPVFSIKGSRILLISGALVIPVLISIIFGNFPIFKKSEDSGQSEQILEKAISNCDFYHKWENFHTRVRLFTVYENGSHNDEIIEIQTREGFYQSTFSSGDLHCIKGVKDGVCFREIDGDKNPDPRLVIRYSLDNRRIRYMKELHYCHFGLLMELKKSGMKLQKEVKKEVFNGSKCLALTFLSDSTQVQNEYFRDLNYVVYLDRNDYSMKGVQWFGRLNAYIIFSGIINVNGIKVPLSRTVINSEDNSVKYIDMMTFAE